MAEILRRGMKKEIDEKSIEAEEESSFFRSNYYGCGKFSCKYKKYTFSL